MKKVALVFALAVFVPSLVLAWLAVLSLRDQEFVLERQRSLLYQGVTDTLAKQAETFMSERQHEFGYKVEEMLADRPVLELARSFDERLRTNWPLAEVGFVVSSAGKIISPTASSRPAAREFVTDNGSFLENRESVEVYLGKGNFNPNIGNTANLSVPNEYNNRSSFNSPANDLAQSQTFTDSSSAQGQVPSDKSVAQSRSLTKSAAGQRSVQPLKQQVDANEYRKFNDETATQQGQQLQFSKVAPAQAEFQQLIGDANEGTLGRFVNNKLNVLLWYRSPRDPSYTFGVQLALPRVVPELGQLSQGLDPSLREEICVAVLDDKARPVALTQPGFKASWKHPFVATEIGESLPHWEVAAYLLNPEQLSDSARTIRLTLGLLIVVLLLAIGIGSWLIVTDLNRQLALARQKTDFVSNVSHELKTPLTSIRMFSELLAEQRVSDPAKQRSYLQIITAETARLTRLINNVLDFSRMERGEKKYNFRDCDLLNVIRDTAESYRPHLENNGFQLLCDLPPGEMPVRADTDSLAQVIVNLLSNAEKYSNGAKEITIEAGRRDGPLPCVEVRVLDRGLGVPRGSEERIFEKFYRAHDSLASGIQGSGLGLTLARQIARAHGGDVFYESRKGGGSSFSLRLPLIAQHEN